MAKIFNEKQCEQIKEIIDKLYDLYCPFSNEFSKITDYDPSEIKKQIFDKIIQLYRDSIDDTLQYIEENGMEYYEEADMITDIEYIFIDNVFARNSSVTKIFKPNMITDIEYECFWDKSVALNNSHLMLKMLKIMNFPICPENEKRYLRS